MLNEHCFEENWGSKCFEHTVIMEQIKVESCTIINLIKKD
jgi:hypothetical protein